jgi:hypothetical protein
VLLLASCRKNAVATYRLAFCRPTCHAGMVELIQSSFEEAAQAARAAEAEQEPHGPYFDSATLDPECSGNIDVQGRVSCYTKAGIWGTDSTVWLHRRLQSLHLAYVVTAIRCPLSPLLQML